MTNHLNVYLNRHKVGSLLLGKGGRLAFQYSSEWLSSKEAMPLSLALPLHAESFDDDSARPFFANLLPESDIRKVIAHRLGLSEGNDFALLEAVGGECAGAVSLFPGDSEPVKKGGYRTLDDEQLNALIADLPKHPMLVGEEGIRLSLAGAQNKLPVRFDGKRISLPMGSAPSSHILKPPIAHHLETVQNEWFCMQLARKVGLPVPKVSILQKNKPLYLVERYDRRVDTNGKLDRVHQEDFCQAMSILPNLKYEKEGGPGLVQCFNLLRENSLTPIADIQALLKWVAFNYLIGNADAHGKNISILFSEGGISLAPFYDLMSTAVYPELATRYAMKIGGEDRPRWIIERRWRAFADETGINFKLVRQILLQMKEQVSNQAQGLANVYRVEHGGCEIIDRIVNVIEERRRKIGNALAVVSG